MKKALSVLLTALFLFSLAGAALAAEEREALRFRQDGTFTILHVTDTQDDHHPSWDMLNLLKRSIEEERAGWEVEEPEIRKPEEEANASEPETDYTSITARARALMAKNI